MTDRDTVVRRLALGGVVISATVLSYSTLHHRALAIGIPEWSAWFYPVLYDTFILGASRMWQNLGLSDATRKLAKRATVGGIVAAIVAFIIEFAPRGWFATIGALMIPAAMATALVLTSRAAADRKAAAEKAQDEPAAEKPSLVPVWEPEPHTAVSAPATKYVEPEPPVMLRETETIPTKVIEMPEPQDKREWIHAQLDAGEELTGAQIDRKFGGRNGSRTLKSVQTERATRNGHRVVTV